MNYASWDVYLRRELRRRQKREAEFRVIVWAGCVVGCVLIWWVVIAWIIKMAGLMAK